MSYWQHLVYLARHKWFVFQSGRERGVPIWQLIIHDWSKFLPDEFIPYTNQFFRGGNRAVRTPQFEAAFRKHCRRNPHHWEHWDRPTGPLQMPDRYVYEMLADWDGSARAKPNGIATIDWYWQNAARMRLHPSTRVLVEYLLREPISAQ